MDLILLTCSPARETLQAFWTVLPDTFDRSCIVSILIWLLLSLFRSNYLLPSWDSVRLTPTWSDCLWKSSINSWTNLFLLGRRIGLIVSSNISQCFPVLGSIWRFSLYPVSGSSDFSKLLSWSSLLHWPFEDSACLADTLSMSFLLFSFLLLILLITVLQVSLASW